MAKKSVSKLLESILGKRDPSTVRAEDLLDEYARKTRCNVDKLKTTFRGVMADNLLDKVRTSEKKQHEIQQRRGAESKAIGWDETMFTESPEHPPTPPEKEESSE